MHRALFLLDVTQHGTRYTSTCMEDDWVGEPHETLDEAEDEYMGHADPVRYPDDGVSPLDW